MGRKRKRRNNSLSIHRVESPKIKKNSVKKWVTALNNSYLIETLSNKKEKNLELSCQTSESTSDLPKNNLLLSKGCSTSNKPNEKICDNSNSQLLNQTIDLCQEDNSISGISSCSQAIEIPSKADNIAEIVDLSRDTPDQSEVILLKDVSKASPNSNKIHDTPVIDLSDDENGENKHKSEININDDIVVVKRVSGVKKSAAPSQFTRSLAHSLTQNCLIKSAKNISNSSSINLCKEKNNVQLQTRLQKSKKKKLKSTLQNRHKLTISAHQENLLPRSGSSEVGKNVYLNSPVCLPSSGLRPVIIDGSNVAICNMARKGLNFSCKKLQICINYFKKRGHKVTAFVPQFRTKFNKSDNPALLNKLVQDGDVILTPSKIVEGKCIVPYDDRYIVQTAVLKGGVIVSRDNYRDLLTENPAWAETINYRTLPFTWVDDVLMFPDDPLGEYGPSLDEFLKFH